MKRDQQEWPQIVALILVTVAQAALIVWNAFGGKLDGLP